LCVGRGVDVGRKWRELELADWNRKSSPTGHVRAVKVSKAIEMHRPAG
jgi:hypothetical protein